MSFHEDDILPSRMNETSLKPHQKIDDWLENMKFKEQEYKKLQSENKASMKENSTIVQENKQLLIQINALKETLDNLKKKEAKREKLKETKTHLLKANNLLQRQGKELTSSVSSNKNDTLTQDFQNELNDLKNKNKLYQQYVKELHDTLSSNQTDFNEAMKQKEQDVCIAEEKYETLSKDYDTAKTKLEEAIQNQANLISKDQLDEYVNKYVKSLAEINELHKIQVNYQSFICLVIIILVLGLN